MQRLLREEIVLSGVALAMAGIAPNLFPAAQKGIASMPFLASWVLLPSIAVLVAALAVAVARGHGRLVNRILAGAAAGLVATVALEAIRIPSFRLFHGMPGSMPELLGVLITNRFMEGPSLGSDVLGWAYHFWNGACFGMIFAIAFGRRASIWYLVYAWGIGLGFLLSPAVQAMGIGFMGFAMPAMPVTVVVAHTAFGLTLAATSRRWVRGDDWLLADHIPSEGDAHPAHAGAAAGGL